MKPQSSEGLDVVLEQAAQWHARMDCGTADISDFERWREADPRNAAAFARMLGTAQQLSALKPALKQKAAPPSRRQVWQAAAASAALVVGGGGAFYLSSSGRVSAKTAVGDQVLRILPDGGQLHINTDSEVQWQFTDRRRDIWLEKGEIALSVPKSAQPLVLRGGGQKVEVQAGTFNARLRNGALDFLMLEGTAFVLKDGGTIYEKPNRILVAQGHAMLAGRSTMRLRPMSPDDIQFVSAWQSGEVFFNGETLGTAAEEYNRYLRHKIAIGDPSLQGIRLGGRFNSRDPQVFLSSLHDAFGINASRTEDGSIILTR